ncbi:MAG TPA: CoA transferase [Dehalococcoidia bacterium]|jgi:crotonobetainyl-CoA:carnitine CoA-transferase CaiB-like acyl-CoA transferase
MVGALNGVTVIDFTEYIAGPYCTMMLADMGADVIKIERPEGDAWRHTAPVAPYEGRGYLGVNRGKRSVALDLERDEARAVALRMCAHADVVVMNYRPGVAERLGIGYDALSVANPSMIYCENTAFGRDGPLAGRGGFDILSQAATGMILYENKIERGLPTYIATTAVADITSGMMMAFAIVSALYARVATGKGQRIETSLFASGLAAQYRPLLSVEAVDRPVRDGFLTELAARRLKEDVRYEDVAKLRREYVSARGRNNYYRVYETRDGLIAIGCLNNRQRRKLRDALGIEDATVEGFAYDWFSEDVRRAHHATTGLMEEALATKSTAGWITVLEPAGVPCAEVNFPEELFEHPHVEANGLMLTLQHDILGPIRMPAPPIRMSETPAAVRFAPPPLGAHGLEVLRQFGYDDASIDELFKSGALVTRERRMAQDAGERDG